MHLLGHEIQVTLTPPRGKARTLLKIRDWDYHWQETYVLRQPLAIKAGTRLDVDADYDNSERNGHNPNNPPRLVLFGPQLTDEMCLVSLGLATDKPGRIRAKLQPPQLRGAASH
jgi:hypothetical protein